MFLGYNTNGFAFHRTSDAVMILGELGYKGVGLTLDYHCLNPYSETLDREIDQVGALLDKLEMRCVVETGARFLLDPWRKHQPTLISPTAAEREKRSDFLCRSVRLARSLRADAVSFWAGTAIDDASMGELDKRLVESLKPVLAEAHRCNIPLALEPEPGMHLATVARTLEVVDHIADPLLKLTIDVGHLHCLDEGDIPELLMALGDRVINVHIEDMRRGVHDHLMFGEGEMEFPPLLQALKKAGYQGGVYVELSRHAHNAVAAARQALDFLTNCQGLSQ